MRRELIVIESDLYDIAWRLKAIDAGYTLVRNARLDRFEVYKDGAIQIVSPFRELDARLLAHARRTRVENAARLIRELDESNAATAAAAEKKSAEKARERLLEVDHAG
jgi:hypothetical protein